MKAGKILIQGVFTLIFVLFACQQVVFSGELELTPGEKRRIESGAIDTFEQIIFLCKTERFDQIYEYGNKTSRERISKEMFISQNKPCWLASSWEAVRNVEVEIVSPTRVYLKAVLGFPGQRAYGVLGETEFSTQIFEMTLEEGEWRIDLRHPYGIKARQQDNK
jgi:hypothetical protein